MTDLTDERLAEIRALAEAATPGEWFTDHAREVCAMLGGISPVLIAETGTSGELVVEQSEADAAFIALGPKTTLSLLDALTSTRERAEKAEARVAVLEGLLREAGGWSGYEDEIAEAISDSMDMDWTSRDGARAVVRLLNEIAALRRGREIERANPSKDI